jgi:glycerophosphoryl diester phosphodiesterase
MKRTRVKWRTVCLLALLVSGVLNLHGSAAVIRFISHRGESLDAPENTLAAFQLAADRKTAGFECDIYRTSDNEIACIHDATTTRTTDGSLTVSASTLAELRGLDAGAWMGPRYAGERIPTLAETLALAHDGFEIYVEIKCGTEILPRLIETLAAEPKATPDRVCFICFTANVIAALRQQLPAYRVYWLTSTKRNADGSTTPTAASAVATALACGASGIDAQASDAITASYVSEVKAAGLSFHVWTVDSASSAFAYAKMGVDTVTTDCGRALADALGQSSVSGPVIRWTFDGVTTNVGSGGASYDASLSGMPAYTNGIVGRALALDGVDDVAGVAYRLTDEGTIACWYRADAFYNFNTVFDDAAGADDWEMWINADKMLTFRVAGTNNSGRVAYELNGLNDFSPWHHVAVTWSRASGKTSLYLNGVLRSTGTITNWVAPGSEFCLGGGTPGNIKGKGAVDDVRIYDEVLPASEIQTLATPVPVIHWAFDGGATNSGSGGAAYDAVLSGSPAYTNGIDGRALALDGVNDFAGTAYQLPEQGTIALWYRPEAFYNYNTVFDNSVNPDGWEMWIYSDGRLTFRVKNNGSGQMFYDLDNLNGSNQWYHIALTWDKASSNVTLYVNGLVRSSGAITNWVAPGASFYVGGGNAGNAKGRGAVDDVRVYDRVLAATEIQTLQANVAALAPVVRWAFDGAATNGGTGGARYDATLHGGPVYTNGVGEKAGALYLDGVGDFVSVPYRLQDRGAVALWYRPQAFYNWNEVFDNSANGGWWKMWIDGAGGLTFRTSGDAYGCPVSYSGLNSLNGSNRWYHLAVTWDATKSNTALYVNGQLRASSVNTNGTAWRTPGAAFYLGGGNAGNSNGMGCAAEVRIYEAPLSAEQIRAVFEEQGETVYLPFDGSPDDQAGGDHGASLSGTSCFVKGEIGRAFSALGANGATNNAAIPYTLTEAVTITMWYYARGPWYNYQTVFDNSVNADWWEMWIYNDGRLTFRVKNNGSGQVVYDLDNLKGPGQWYHVAVTWDKATGKTVLYINGVARSTGAITDWTSPGNAVYLGGHTGNTPGVGVWDEVRIFNRVLSAKEIKPLAHKFSNGTTMRIQ